MSQTHPKVDEFKDFVKRHPKIVKEVRSNKKTWQELFEDWYLFGEDDSMWEKYKDNHSSDENRKDKSQNTTTKKDSDFMSQVLSIVKNIDMNEMQKNLSSVSGAISNVQQLIEQFQGFKNTNKHHSQSRQGPRNPHHPFFYHKD